MRNRYREISQFRKSFDAVTNWIYYPLASYLCAILSYTSITPNQITILSILSELSAVYLIITSFDSNLGIIAILLQLGWILDLMDGMMARFKKMGYYNPINPSKKGYYLDAVSDHVLKFVIIGALSYQLVLIHKFGWQIGMITIIIYGITQTEHTLRKMITKSDDLSLINGRSKKSIFGHIALLMNNIYLFYIVFIPINRIDLLLIGFASASLILFIKRTIQFWFSEP